MGLTDFWALLLLRLGQAHRVCRVLSTRRCTSPESRVLSPVAEAKHPRTPKVPRSLAETRMTHVTPSAPLGSAPQDPTTTSSSSQQQPPTATTVTHIAKLAATMTYCIHRRAALSTPVAGLRVSHLLTAPWACQKVRCPNTPTLELSRWPSVDKCHGQCTMHLDPHPHPYL
ncbi:hypothetical protein ACLKA7_007056 [Drosophila subpalustris]